MSIICRYMPQGDRLFFWKSSGYDVPDGMRLGQSCKVVQCGKFEHFQLVANRRHGWTNWAKYRDVLLGLEPGEFAEIPEYPNDEASIRKLRSGILSSSKTSIIKFLIHKIPWGGVRIARIGNWGSIYRGIDESVVDHQFHPPTRRRVPAHLRPAVTFLGLLHGTASKRAQFDSNTCAIQGCGMHPIDGELCRHHFHFFDYPISTTGDQFDRRGLWSPWEPYAPYELAAEYPRSIESLEKSLRFVRNGYDHEQHKNLGNDELEPGPGFEEPKKKPYKRTCWNLSRVRDLERKADELLGISKESTRIEYVPISEREFEGQMFKEVTDDEPEYWERIFSEREEQEGAY